MFLAVLTKNTGFCPIRHSPNIPVFSVGCELSLCAYCTFTLAFKCLKRFLKFELSFTLTSKS